MKIMFCCKLCIDNYILMQRVGWLLDVVYNTAIIDCSTKMKVNFPWHPFTSRSLSTLQSNYRKQKNLRFEKSQWCGDGSRACSFLTWVTIPNTTYNHAKVRVKILWIANPITTLNHTKVSVNILKCKRLEITIASHSRAWSFPEVDSTRVRRWHLQFLLPLFQGFAYVRL